MKEKQPMAVRMNKREAIVRAKQSPARETAETTMKTTTGICEVCDEKLKPGEERFGCERCGRMFGPCCNTEQDGICVDCA